MNRCLFSPRFFIVFFKSAGQKVCLPYLRPVKIVLYVLNCNNFKRIGYFAIIRTAK